MEGLQALVEEDHRQHGDDRRGRGPAPDPTAPPPRPVTGEEAGIAPDAPDARGDVAPAEELGSPGEAEVTS